jgi:hypothetical protein
LLSNFFFLDDRRLGREVVDSSILSLRSTPL